MHLLRLTLLICAIAGFWQPASWGSLLKSIIYKTYALFLMSALYMFTLSQFMYIVMNVANSDEITDALYMLLTVLVAAYKQTFMWIDHKNIKVIIDTLTQKPFAPCESNEGTIRQKFDKMIRFNTLRYLILVVMSIMSIIFTSVTTELMRRNLTYKAWVPFDYSSPAVFFLVYVYQLIGMSVSGLVNVACESLICGFLLHICCQYELLEHRLTKVTQESDIIGDCVHHHNRIFTYAYRVNSTFAKVIALQFGVSTLVVCSNLFRIAMADDYMSFIPLIFYTNAILVQIFLYCWFGNEVKLKAEIPLVIPLFCSSAVFCRMSHLQSLRLMDSVYEIEWPSLSNDNKKSLLLIMRRSMVPIEFSSAYLITLNLDSFVALLKLSYSIFNLMRQTHE